MHAPGLFDLTDHRHQKISVLRGFQMQANASTVDDLAEPKIIQSLLDTVPENWADEATLASPAWLLVTQSFAAKPSLAVAPDLPRVRTH